MSSSPRPVVVMLVVSLASCGGDGGDDGRNKSPLAQLTIAPTTGAAPLTITGSGDRSSDPDGTIAAFAWDFGDGSRATGPRVEHTYATVGEFVVTLTVTDDAGATGNASARVVATGSTAVYNGALFDESTYQAEPGSGTFDATVLQ